MARSSGPNRQGVTPEDVLQVFGRIDDAKVVAIVEAQASYEDLEEAAAWLADEGETLRKMKRPLSGKAATVYEILQSELEEPQQRERP